MTVPCGRCIGCRLENSRQWAVRMMHEQQMHEDSSFITLTYSEQHLPPGGSLQPEDFQRFMKRLRRRLSPRKIRFFHCGEYGDSFDRPHYHAALFGTRFDDRVPWATRNGQDTWRSPLLEEVWPFGHAEIGSLTFESAAYVARYVTKKLAPSSDMDEETYHRWQERYVNKETGEIKAPEYATMSRRPGIGKSWLEKYISDVYPHDEVIINGKPSKPPRYYDSVLADLDPETHQAVLKQRRLGRDRENETPARLQVRKVCVNARLNLHNQRKSA